MKVCKNTLGKQ